MKIGWLELWAGLGGDMFVGALLDAGWEESRLRAGIEALGLGPVDFQVERRAHQGMTGLGIRVEPREEAAHRGFAEIERILSESSLPEDVRRRSLQAFRLLGEAESRVHGIALEQVHFHELGAVDTLVDVVGSVLGVHDLGLEAVLAGPVPIGGGEVVMAHGRMPSPAPATALLLEGWPVRPAPAQGEFLTPTAAALLRVLARPVMEIPSFHVDRVGYGAGTRRHPTWPNLVRLWVGRQDPSPGLRTGATDSGAPQLGQVSVLETQVDDMDPRFLSALADRLAAEGALDVLRTPVLMKKGRGGVLLTVICRVCDAPRLAGFVLSQSTTLGVRLREEARLELQRRTETVSTELGDVRVKWAGPPGGERPSPEYEDLLALSLLHRLPLDEVLRRVLSSLARHPRSPSGEPQRDR